MSNTGPGPNQQLNLVLSIVAPVIALIAVLVLFFTRPVPLAPTPPAAVNTTVAKLPDSGVVMANSLPGSGSAAAGGASSGSFGAPSGGPPGGGGRGFSGPPPSGSK